MIHCIVSYNVGEDANTVWNGTCGTSCNVKTNDRGLRLLEFASSNDLILANTFGTHKPSRKWTWHSPNHEHHNQIDYIMIRKRFRSSVNFPQTRSFPAADIGSDHDLVMMTFRLRLLLLSCHQTAFFHLSTHFLAFSLNF